MGEGNTVVNTEKTNKEGNLCLFLAQESQGHLYVRIVCMRVPSSPPAPPDHSRWWVVGVLLTGNTKVSLAGEVSSPSPGVCWPDSQTVLSYRRVG